ncbi:sensor histidine kinase [Microbacterium alcoholitolerans]|uniref:sensor histidine kinase n=1 Tax=unclassified Microbacterium TaxID=2609290 RepID=UPI003D16CB36
MDRGISPARDAADDLRRLLVTAGVVLGAFSIGAAVQSVFVYGAPSVLGSTLEGVPSLILRTVVNLFACAAALALCAWTHLPRLSVTRQIVTALIIGTVTAFLRHALQIVVGTYAHPSMQTSLVEVVSGGIVVILAIALGMAQMLSQARLRTQERAAAEQRLRATTALAALSEEELRVRRSVAENLHGGLQGRLVMIRVQLDRVVARWRAGTMDDTDQRVLEHIRDELDAVREHEVRQVSHLLYPAGVDTGLAYALTRLVRRVPPEIRIDVDIDDVFDHETGPDSTSDATVVWRVALLRAAEEAISNALLHGGAARIGVQLLARNDDGDRVVLIVDDDGSGMPDGGVPRRGLALSEERLKRLGGRQRLETSPRGGVRLIAELPVRDAVLASAGSQR